MELTGAELTAKSIELAEKYCQEPPSSVVLLLLPHSAELFLLHLGLVLTGRLPAILAWPTNRIDPGKYQRNLVHQLQNLPAAQLLTLPKLAQNLDPGLSFTVTGCPVHQYEEFEARFSVKLHFGAVEKKSTPQENGAPHDGLFLQFSGGTTGDQKCVIVTAPMLVNQLARLGATLQFDERDGVVSWLPMYHDMGLIACLWLPLWNGAPSVQFAAIDWLMHPGRLFEFLHRYKATFCWLPNFAFSYLAAQRSRVDQDFDLGHVRAFINCSEPLRQSSIEAFAEAFSFQGVRPDQCQASYAMAENVFAVTQTPLGTELVKFPRQAVRAEDDEPTSYDLLDKHYISSGNLLPDTSMRIRDADNNLCGDDVPGEIEIRGQSLFCAYWGSNGFQTQSLTEDGWYATGDYGFTHENDLFVVGRVKDIIIVSGANIFPEDIEALVNKVKGIYPGRAVAFGVDDQRRGTESLAVVAEMRGEFDSLMASELEHKIRHLIISVLGITARYVRVTPERWIVKSTAGKISRRETRLRFVEELATHGAQVRVDA